MKDEEKDESVIYVSQEDWDLIQDLIKNPRQPKQALIDLFERNSFKQKVKKAIKEVEESYLYKQLTKPRERPKDWRKRKFGQPK